MSIYYDQDNYELSTPIEVDGLLAELPFGLIKESILDQIQNPLSSTTNYLDVIVDKCEMLRAQYDTDESFITELNQVTSEFFIDILTEINDRFGLGLDINEVATYSNISEVTESFYRYFILRYSKNITRFISKYIFNNKKDITNYYNDNKQKKDVSTLAFKKQIKNPEDLCIITNLPSIIKYIIGLDIDSIDFIDLSVSEDNYDANVIKSLISSGRMIGDFYEAYIQLCIDSHYYIIDELQTEIRIKIIKKITN